MDAPAVLIAGRYRLVRRVGSGGMGVVWEAYDERLQRTVALKQLHAQVGVSEVETRMAYERAMREARITARLDHPNAVPVFDVVTHDGQPCLIMQFLPSEPLSVILKDRKRLPFEEVARIGAQVASALAAAHRLGIVHRDVKPGNVLIARDGTARISDFGISHALGDVTLTMTGMVHGTPAFLAPEVARGADSTFKSDVFGLGATLYAAVEGTPPFGVNVNSIALLYKVASGEFDPPDPEGPLTPLLLRMLAPDPQDRPDMAEMADALGRASRPDAAADAGPSPSLVTTRRLSASLPPAVPSAPAPGSEPAARAWPPVTASAAAQPPPRDLPTDATARSAPRRALSDEPPENDPPGNAPRPEDAAPPVGPPGAAVASSSDDASGSSGSRRRLVRTLVVLAVLVGAGALLLNLLPSIRQTQADPPIGAAPATSRSATTEASTSPTPSQTTAAPPPASPSASATPSRSATPSPSAGPTPTSSSPAPPSATEAQQSTPQSTPTSDDDNEDNDDNGDNGDNATARQLREAVTGYYAQMPGDTDAGWDRLTRSYQRGSARSRDTYERFWGGVDRVSVSGVQVDPPDTVEATVTYRLKNGRVSRERTSFELVEDDGELKINATRVLSSN